MSTFVWIDSWQQQCCGDDFEVGSTVRWSAVPQDGPDEWVELLLGHDWASKVDYHEEHHVDEESTVVITGMVRSIWEVGCNRQERDDRGGRTWFPIAGSGTLRKVEVAHKWSPEPPDDLRPQVTFDGWVVELELHQSAG